jgi:bifunctional non-homologous end joining protein LigD
MAAHSPDEALAPYRAKRDFSRTAEPSGDTAPTAGFGSFVVQHHWATREHYDFRLELDGVLLSWAVTKGPSLDPSVKRLAVHTEDHPLAYAAFEGTIPKGEYGGGTVMLWDRGTWTPVDPDPRAALDAGMLKFILAGERMKGHWVLVRLKPEGKRENWLLIKEKDALADRAADLIAANPTSVSTGRTKAEIEAEVAPTSFKGRSVEAAMAATAKPKAQAKAKAAAGTDASPPDFVPPMLCATRKTAPEGDDWIHEMKYDGYRLQAACAGAAVRLHTREGHDWVAKFPGVATALQSLDLDRVLLDGEAVIFDANGLSDFARLIAALDGRGLGIAFVAFDILSAGGEDLTGLPLLERKRRLAEVLSGADGRTIRLASWVTGNGPEVFEQAVKGGAEGIVSKRADSTYRSGRGTAWAKVKGDRREDVVVIGYMPSERRPFASLLAAVETPEGLRFAGGIGTGYDAAELKRTRARLDADRLDGPPDELIDPKNVPRKAVFVAPKYRVEVAFTGWTGDGRLRHPRFLGWREDRAPRPQAGRQAMAKRTKSAEPVGPTGGKPDAAPAPAKAAKSNAKAAMSPAKTAGSAARKARAAPVDVAAELERISHGDRVMFPEAGVTKADVARHYLAVAERMMPHLEGRPVSFVRAPEGLAGETFFQRHLLPGMKKGLARVPAPEGDKQGYMRICNLDGLVTAAQFGVIEIHGWGTVLPDLDRPDRLVFDFDPDEGLGFEDVKTAATEMRDLLQAVGLASYPMASGGKGLHLVVPLDGSQTWDEIGDFTAGVARGLARFAPDRYVAVMAKKRRTGKIFIDWLRNRRSATAVLPWSLRARPKATVAVPLAWDEVPGLASAGAWTVSDITDRTDPWTDFWTRKQRIDPAALNYLQRFLKV